MHILKLSFHFLRNRKSCSPAPSSQLYRATMNKKAWLLWALLAPNSCAHVKKLIYTCTVWIVSFFLNQLYYCADCFFTSRRQTMHAEEKTARAASSKRDARLVSRRDALFDSRFSSCRAGNLFGIKDSCI